MPYNNSPEKITIDDCIIQKSKQTPFKWKDINHFQFEDEDEIHCHYIEPFYSEDNSWDGHFSFSVFRKREETDQEFEKRQKEIERNKKRVKEERYKRYLELKKEFEPDNTDNKDTL